MLSSCSSEWSYAQTIRKSRRAGTIALNGALALCVIVLSGPPTFALHGVKNHDAKQQIEQLEDEWRAAQMTGDVATMDRLLSDDYIGISMSGQVNTKAQQLARIRSHALTVSRLDIEDRKIKLLGQVAVVTVRASVQGVNEGTPLNGNFRYTRVYQHLPTGAWKITNFEATRIPGEGKPQGLANSPPGRAPDPNATDKKPD